MMKGNRMGIALAWALSMAAAASGCGDDGSTSGGGTGGTGGSGGSTDTGGGGADTTSSSTTSSTTSSSTTTTTTTTSKDPCAGEITGYTPDWRPSEGHHQGLCTDAQQIEDFFKACIEIGATQEDCEAFTDASDENAACAMCAVSAPEDATYGPMTIYTTPQVLYENPGQCVSVIEGDDSDASCGAKIFFAIQCSVTACEGCVYGDDFDVLLDCLAKADAGDCKSHVDAKDACLADLGTQGVPIDVCLPPTSGGNTAFFNYLKEMTLLSCGP